MGGGGYKPPRCPKCSSDLLINPRLTLRYRERSGREVEIFYCGKCVDELYFLHEGRLYTSKEWL